MMVQSSRRVVTIYFALLAAVAQVVAAPAGSPGGSRDIHQSASQQESPRPAYVEILDLFTRSKPNTPHDQDTLDKAKWVSQKVKLLTYKDDFPLFWHSTPSERMDKIKLRIDRFEQNSAERVAFNVFKSFDFPRAPFTDRDLYCRVLLEEIDLKLVLNNKYGLSL
ncbi:hypothetical protein EV361DRAFT_937461 [Lentinula raphanica]|nr:hypothetical protein EV361DRAFT_937461 [Lentinula raphanica]